MTRITGRNLVRWSQKSRKLTPSGCGCGNAQPGSDGVNGVGRRREEPDRGGPGRGGGQSPRGVVGDRVVAGGREEPGRGGPGRERPGREEPGRGGPGRERPDRESPREGPGRGG